MAALPRVPAQNVEYLCLVFDLCEGGDLEAFGCNGHTRLTPSQLKFVGLQMVVVLCHLHKHHVMHRDIKPANVLIDSEGHLKLIDFGTAKMGDREVTSREECGTRAYQAPEVFHAELNTRSYDDRCDLFSLGCVMYELAEQALPFGEAPRYVDLNREFRQPSLVDEATGLEHPHLFDLLVGLLDWNPADRLGGDDSRALHPLHPFHPPAPHPPPCAPSPCAPCTFPGRCHAIL